MKRKWSSAWNTGFIGTIGLRKSTGGPAPKKGLETLPLSSQLKWLFLGKKYLAQWNWFFKKCTEPIPSIEWFYFAKIKLFR